MGKIFFRGPLNWRDGLKSETLPYPLEKECFLAVGMDFACGTDLAIAKFVPIARSMPKLVCVTDIAEFYIMCFM